ncbi:MAG: HAMP domain-containing sensor histidine kinase [Pseudomonadota bacterium]|uniref:sensor histidine kinase n=1 Tax=Caldimonas aquatica TaxID=376175 RepID=UPI0034723D9E
MKSLYLRIYLTVVAVLLLFALLAGWLFQRNIEHAREQDRVIWGDRLAAWGELAQHALPDADAPRAEQADALEEWSQRLRVPLALDDPSGRRISSSALYERVEREGARRRLRLPLGDGRVLWVLRPQRLGPLAEGPPGRGPEPRHHPPPALVEPPWFLRGGGLVAALVVLFIAVSAGAYPVVRRLTRQLEALKRGVETFGSGELSHRVAVSGRDEVAAVAASFNQAAERIEALVRSHQSLLANASHELRSPLARLKMALSLLETAEPQARARLQQEIAHNIEELDTLVEEVLFASRLDAMPSLERGPVDLLGLAAEEGVRFGAELEGEPLVVAADERLVRRALRNLLENARRYAPQTPPMVQVRRGPGRAELRVCDRGPGVPADQRERIFEPFYRLPGHAEHAGGVGLGLSLVRQIARRHGGDARCEAREGGGSCFVVTLPLG